MSEPELIIIKLGGSVITDKTKSTGVFNMAIVDRVAKEIANVLQKKKFKLIIVNGAGSYGHPIAKKYDLDKGLLNQNQWMGFALTKEAVLKLSLLVCKEFLEEGLRISIVQPSEVISVSGDKIKRFELGQIKGLIKNDIIPMLYGDVILDDLKGFSIISGDTIVTYLAKKLNARKVIFLSDVDGVFDKNPKIYNDAKLIRVIDDKNFEKIMTQQTTVTFDVTGEMKGKLFAIKRALKAVDVSIVSGLVQNVVTNALLGKTVGTKILFS